MDKQKSKAGKKGAKVKYAKRYELLDELRKFISKASMEKILKSRVDNNILEQLIGYHHYRKEINQ